MCSSFLWIRTGFSAGLMWTREKAGHFLISGGVLNFSRWIMLHGVLTWVDKGYPTVARGSHAVRQSVLSFPKIYVKLFPPL
jgi:hypothetical protein